MACTRTARRICTVVDDGLMRPCGTRASPKPGREGTRRIGAATRSVSAPAAPAHVLDPARALRLVGASEPAEDLGDRLDLRESQDAPLEGAQSPRAETPAIDGYRHAHDRCAPSARRTASSGSLRSYGKIRTGRCSREDPRRAPRMVPCQSGNRNTQWPAQRMSSCGPLRVEGSGAIEILLASQELEVIGTAMSLSAITLPSTAKRPAVTRFSRNIARRYSECIRAERQVGLAQEVAAHRARPDQVHVADRGEGAGHSAAGRGIPATKTAAFDRSASHPCSL